MNLSGMKRRLKHRSTMRAAALVVIFALVQAPGGATAKKQGVSVPVCRGITLSASYVTATGEGKGPGFEFTLANDTHREIRLVEPLPSSAHWYALTNGRWMWRASNGAGGNLVDATKERGPLIAYRGQSSRVSGDPILVKPHETRTWVASAEENPVLEYKPSCHLCSYPGEREYRVVFAYAFLPTDKEKEEGLLACGLRSKPVPMPPKS
jgi:hypothetical protein